ncbi:hypothetical protein [Daejeonella lutea]|uniref:Calycin-like beta-barrel domain-containing protein n=1 Tax=Daejeonella lutea TaxID=572036 RepID=A0A1T5AK45_9SPHI|nr:hypothetical protein [Daejeonella lutea]SKB35209.1 hypothetical protein SAMN05661099_0802 [Daejeonella lutea]
MKALTLVFLILFAFSDRSYSQCGKNINLTGSKTQHLNESGKVTRTEEEKSYVHISKSIITITVKDEFKASCTIKSVQCDWSIPFKKGRTTIHAVMTNDMGEPKDLVLSIEGSDLGLFLLFEIIGSPGDKVKVALDKFEEAA